jgi:hypothetical protein
MGQGPVEPGSAPFLFCAFDGDGPLLGVGRSDYLSAIAPSTPRGRPMSKREDQRLAALAKKNAEKVVQPKGDKSVQFDPTLRQRHGEEDPETRRLFKEMKKREF